MIIGGLQKTSLIEYPGKVSAIIFTRGCALSCHYCHNPELVIPSLFGKGLSEDYVLGYLRSRTKRLDGAVISGGEPTIHADLPSFLSKIKEMGYLIKLDTCGMHPDMLQNVIEKGLVDYIAMDVKAPLGKYKLVTGVEVREERIRRSIEMIKSSNIDYEFRTTIVKNQLTAKDIRGIAEMVAGARIYFLQKFNNSKTLDPDFKNAETYTDEEFDRIRNDVSRYVSACYVR